MDTKNNKKFSLKIFAYQQLVLWVLIIFLMLFADRPITYWVNAHRTAEIFHIFDVITGLGKASFIWLLAIGLSCLYWLVIFFKPGIITEYWKERVHYACIAVFLALITSGLIVTIMKFLAGRPRPKELLENNLYGLSGPDLTFKLSSFPSGHSQAAFAFFTILALLFPRARYIFFIAAIIISLSRIAVGSHFPSDIIMGGYIGWITAVYCWNLQVNFPSPRLRGEG